MFLENFILARDCLNRRGFKSALVFGSPVSEPDLNALDAETDFPLPSELRQFYLEMGDGFEFIPDKNSASKWVGWEPMRLSDHKLSNIGFGSQLEEETKRKITKPSPRTPPELLLQEMEKRKRWIPFYGFVGGGDYLCLDSSVTPPVVRFYESLTWVAVSKSWDFVLASSFTEFVQQWSRYYFLSPGTGWTSFCRDRSGRFNWMPEYFPLPP